MPEVSHQRARKTIFVMLACGVMLSFAGHKYQQHQQTAEITWQDVSNTMQDVEDAKQDLFQSLNAKATSN